MGLILFWWLASIVILAEFIFDSGQPTKIVIARMILAPVILVYNLLKMILK